MLARQLLDQYIESTSGVIPTTAYNWHSDNSDVSFILAMELQGVIDLWVATGDDKARDMIDVAIEWIFSVADSELPADVKTDVTVDWGPPTQKKHLQLVYTVSPSTRRYPGWCRWINVGRPTNHGQMGFRPEILASGVIGLTIAQYIQDRQKKDEQFILSDRCVAWLNHLAAVFTYHEPNWREAHTHTPGVLFDKPHNDLLVSGYFWPSDLNGSVDNTLPGANQQVQFLVMGVLVENMLGSSIGAMEKLTRWTNDTFLPHMVIKSAEDRAFTLYDLRDNKEEPSNDLTHNQHTCPIFTYGPGMGLIPAELPRQIINQQLDVCHQGNGEMSLLQHGSDEHHNRTNSYHPSPAGLAEMLMFDPNGHRYEEMLNVMEMSLRLEMPNAMENHKTKHYWFRFARALAAQKKRAQAGTVIHTPETEKNQSAGHSVPNSGRSAGAGSQDAEGSIKLKVGEYYQLPGTLNNLGSITGIEGDTGSVHVSNWNESQGVEAMTVKAIKSGSCTIRWMSAESVGKLTQITVV